MGGFWNSTGDCLGFNGCRELLLGSGLLIGILGTSATFGTQGWRASGAIGGRQLLGSVVCGSLSSHIWNWLGEILPLLKNIFPWVFNQYYRNQWATVLTSSAILLLCCLSIVAKQGVLSMRSLSLSVSLSPLSILLHRTDWRAAPSSSNCSARMMSEGKYWSNSPLTVGVSKGGGQRLPSEMLGEGVDR